MNRRRVLTWLVLGALLVWSLLSLDLEAARLGEVPRAAGALARSMWPPVTDAPFLSEVGRGLLETIQIALASTMFGAVLSLPLALAAARNLAPWPLLTAARALASGIRVLPSILWALLVTLIVGLGPLAGVLAMTLYTVGYLSKLQYESIEGVPRDGFEAVRAMGATRFQQAWHVALPESGNALRSQMLFMFEYNVRASSIIGLVGAGGVGQLLTVHLRFFNYAHVLTIILALYVTVVLLDVLSILVRRRFVEAPVRKARWRDVVVGPE